MSPYQFGVYGIATLVLALIEILTETGINVFLIQKKDDVDKYINTAWIVSIARGLVISLVILLTSRFISIFFMNDDVLPLLTLISVVPIIRGFINPSVARFQKELTFDREFLYRSSIFLVETVVSIMLILTIKSPIALIYGLIVGAIFEVFISFKFVTPVPKIEFNKGIFGEIISRGKWVTSAGIFSYMFQNGDNVVVGRVLGARALGIYDMAYSISMLPITEIADIIARVTFPVYVRITEDRERLRRAYIKTTILTGVLVFPVLLIFFLFPEHLIRLVLGSQWISGASVLKVLAVFALIHALGNPASAVFFAFKKQEYLSIINFTSFTVMIITIIPLINAYGTLGAGMAALAGSISAIPLVLYFLTKVLK